MRPTRDDLLRAPQPSVELCRLFHGVGCLVCTWPAVAAELELGLAGRTRLDEFMDAADPDNPDELLRVALAPDMVAALLADE